MELRLVNKRGFSTLEVLMVIFIVSISVTLSSIVVPSIQFSQFKNDYLLTQLQSIAKAKRMVLESEYNSNVNQLSFNALGHVNQAQTVQVKNKQYTVQLGMGRLLDE